MKEDECIVPGLKFIPRLATGLGKWHCIIISVSKLSLWGWYLFYRLFLSMIGSERARRQQRMMVMDVKMKMGKMMKIYTRAHRKLGFN